MVLVALLGTVVEGEVLDVCCFFFFACFLGLGPSERDVLGAYEPRERLVLFVAVGASARPMILRVYAEMLVDVGH